MPPFIYKVNYKSANKFTRSLSVIHAYFLYQYLRARKRQCVVLNSQRINLLVDVTIGINMLIKIGSHEKLLISFLNVALEATVVEKVL